jgi:hypothetical protein
MNYVPKKGVQGVPIEHLYIITQLEEVKSEQFVIFQDVWYRILHAATPHL